MSEIEKDLNKEWKDKCDRLLSSAQEKHERAIADLLEEKEGLEENIKEMDKKVEYLYQKKTNIVGMNYLAFDIT